MVAAHGDEVREFLERLPVRRPQHHQAPASAGRPAARLELRVRGRARAAGFDLRSVALSARALGRGGGAPAHGGDHAGLRHRTLPPLRRAGADDLRELRPVATLATGSATRAGWRARRWIAATGAAATFVSIPRADIGMWSLDHFNTGIRALKTNDLPAGPAFPRNGLCLRAG